MIGFYPDFESLSLGAAELFAAIAADSVRDRGRFIVSLAGGGTPKRAYELLSREPFRDRIAWDRTQVFWGDERCVPPDDPRNNALMARRALLDHVPVPPEGIHPILCPESPRDAAENYEAVLRSFFADGPPRFDLILLGLGENGHTASLFPYTPSLGERGGWVCEVRPTDADTDRVTMTAPLINQARAVVFIVSSDAKAGVLKEVLEGPDDPMRLPAQLIRPELHGGETYWLLDKPAASLLTAASAA